MNLVGEKYTQQKMQHQNKSSAIDTNKGIECLHFDRPLNDYFSHNFTSYN